jgi:hypothetical protein
VVRAAEARSPWLYHPCVSAITHRHADGQRERDVALIVWVARHANLEGRLVLSAPLWCWSKAGGVLLKAGTHSLESIKTAVTPTLATPEIDFDPWCSIMGYSYPDSIPAVGRPESEQEAEVRRSTLIGLRAQALVRACLPAIADWLGALAKVLIFLDASENLSRSASAADLPGIVFADVKSEIALLEVLVHESAHHLLYITEAGGALIDPAENRRFSSPLRSDLRPLRGILLAYHALAFICAFYKDLEQSAVGQGAVDRSDVDGLRAKMADAEITLDSAAGSLTEEGAIFMNATREVARYGT